MGNKFSELAFTPKVKKEQELRGSRGSYARLEEGGTHNDELGPREAAFISARDSFYMATTSETGWPYIQHRGGPVGFVHILNGKAIKFADFKGNRQYISVGNLRSDDRVSLFFMDYPNQTRLKLLGRASLVESTEVQIKEKFLDSGYRARIELCVLITVEAYDWNCPQHIAQRFTRNELSQFEVQSK
ncbi:MAG: pyridoxamine 5'-phosphate oxidase family protein [Aestuariivirga sp.]